MNFNEYYRGYFALRDEMTDEGKAHFDNRILSRQYAPMHLFAFSVWLGGLGVDRFILGHWGRGLGKLFTGGGFGIWQLVDFFLIGSGTRIRNFAIAEGIVADMRALEAESEAEEEAQDAPDAIPEPDETTAENGEAGDE